jgi:redox-sensitive bicupin YhaK (pirin superfamily)
MSFSATTLSPRLVKLTPRTGIEVRRTLPHRNLRMIGAWCFVDHYGPLSNAGGHGAEMSIAAHPHTGLQTVTWLIEGRVEHRDSIGTVQEINPGELNLMTAGRGIAHSEASTVSSAMHGVQLWIALPDVAHGMDPAFAHHDDLPVFIMQSTHVRLLMGELEGQISPAITYSPLIGAEILLSSGANIDFPVRPEFEHGLLILEGDDVRIDGELVELGSLRYINTGSREIQIATERGARVLLIGGAPFEEEIVMWWNFIGRSHEEIVAMRNEWQASLESGSDAYPAFVDSMGAAIPAPEMPNIHLEPR